MYHPNTWSTWDANSLSYLYKVPENAAVLFRFYDNRLKQFTQELQWENIERLGDKSLDGQFFDCKWRVENLLFDVAFAADEDRFVFRLIPRQSSERYTVLIGGALRWNTPGQVSFNGESIRIDTAGARYCISVIGERAAGVMPNDFHSGFILSIGKPIYVFCNIPASSEAADGLIDQQKRLWLSRQNKSGGAAEDALQAVIKAFAWNTVYDPGNHRFVTPVTRRWCSMSVMGHFGNYVLFAWDTFLGAMLAAMQDKDFAIRQLESILEEFDDGHIPHSGSQVHIRSERSQPPVGSFCTLKIYWQFEDISILENAYDRLKSWNGWWLRNRDGNGNGLLEWGVNQSEKWPLPYQYLQKDANDESGMDNSPMHDGIPYSMERQTLEQDYVELNALYALDCCCLAEIAELLGKTGDALAFRAEHQRMAETMNQLLWNEEMGVYCSRRWDGSFNPVVTPGNFYPLLAGITDKHQEKRMLDDWLCNPEKFYGEYMLPTVQRDHPAYRDNDYWRGRVWGPTNYLVTEGLRLCGYEDLAREMAEKSLDMFLQGLRTNGHMYENYNAETGQGDDVENSDPFYTWSGLLPYLFLTAQADVDLFGRLRFGTLSGRGATIDRWVLRGHTYTVDTTNGLSLWRDGQAFMESASRVLIRDYREQNGQMSFCLQMPEGGRLTVHMPEGVTRLSVCGPRGSIQAAADRVAVISFELNTPVIEPGV